MRCELTAKEMQRSRLRMVPDRMESRLLQIRGEDTGSTRPATGPGSARGAGAHKPRLSG